VFRDLAVLPPRSKNGFIAPVSGFAINSRKKSPSFFYRNTGLVLMVLSASRIQAFPIGKKKIFLKFVKAKFSRTKSQS